MRKILLTILLISLFFTITDFVHAQENYPTIIQDYPRLQACDSDPDGCRPGEEGFGFPQFIKYLFIFALGSVGIIGLLAIIMGAFGYVMSVGNPQKAADAKSQILSALLGLLLLLGSWILLNMINPDLLRLRELTLPQIQTAEISWYCYGCCQTIPLVSCNPEGSNGGCGYMAGEMTLSQARVRCEYLVNSWCLFGWNSLATLTPCQ